MLNLNQELEPRTSL